MLTKIAARTVLIGSMLGLAAWAALALYFGPLQSTFWAGAIAAVGLVAFYLLSQILSARC